MMRSTLLLAVSLLACDRFSSQSNGDGGPPPLQVAAWDGTYIGTWTGGDKVVEYKLVVAGNYINVTADGPQTMKRMAANAMAGGTALGAAYADCRPDDMFHCQGLVKGDRLFTVTNIRGTYILRFEKLESPDVTTTEIALTKQK